MKFKSQSWIMDLNKFIFSQKKLALALYRLDVLALEELLSNGAYLLTRSNIRLQRAM